MMRRFALGVLVAGAVSGAASAQDAAGRYARLTAADKYVVDALYAGQRPIAGSPSLSRDDIVSLRTGGGWEVVFESLRAAGYYSSARNMGELMHQVYRYYRPPDTPGDPASGGAAASR